MKLTGFLMLRMTWNIKPYSPQCILPECVSRKWFIFIMMIFPAQTCRFMSGIPRTGWTVIPFCLKETLHFLRNTGSGKADQKGILFPNQFTGRYLTVSTLEQVIRRSASAAGLSGVTPSLPPSQFCHPHLWAGEWNSGIFRHWLGHRDPKSTEVYLHVGNKSIMGIRGPFLTERMVQPMDKPTVQDIFHRFYPAYLDQYSRFPVRAKVAHNIIRLPKTGYPMGANVCMWGLWLRTRFIANSCVTVAAQCVRLFRKKCGWMHAERMSLMVLISIWFLLCILHTWGSEMNFHPTFIPHILLGRTGFNNCSGRTMVKILFFPSGSSPKCSLGENIWRELKRLWEEG